MCCNKQTLEIFLNNCRSLFNFQQHQNVFKLKYFHSHSTALKMRGYTLAIVFTLIHISQSSVASSVEGTKPHIILILADDLGFNDVGYNANCSLIKTPNIDALAEAGVKLNNYYVQPQCTPTRSQLLTGRYQVLSMPCYLCRGNCIPNQKSACFVVYLKIINTFLEK